MTPETPLQAFMPIIVYLAVVAAVCLAIVGWGYLSAWLDSERVARERGLQRALAVREAQRRAYRELDDLYLATQSAIHEQARRH